MEENRKECRDLAVNIYVEPRDAMLGSRAIAHGDRLSLHYKLALPYVERDATVLDIACGGSAGPRILAQKACKVVGGDIDRTVISIACAEDDLDGKVEFRVEDVMSTSFGESSFDVITSFETIEHVDEDRFLAELNRILKPNGLLILSTPQNSLGHIPMNPQHRVEYSFEAITELASRWFDTEYAVGLKQGCIFYEGDPMGTNTFMVLRKRHN
jgi:SAM-dependent methyltransferase